MIKLINRLPYISAPRIELIRIICTFNAYPDLALFWEQDDVRALICMLDNNMVIYNNGADIGELKSFINMISPACVFSDADTLSALFGDGYERVQVSGRECEGHFTPSDKPSSREVYDILSSSGLSLPDYEHFAVDYCHRINRGLADCFYIKDKCAAITFKADDYCILNGISSHKKGMGRVALEAIMETNRGRYMLCCHRDNVKDFYKKCGFKPLYTAGYWRKHSELF